MKQFMDTLRMQATALVKIFNHNNQVHATKQRSGIRAQSVSGGGAFNHRACPKTRRLRSGL